VEGDASVQWPDGRWGSSEVKRTQGPVEEAATNLKQFAKQIDNQRSGSQAFLTVVGGQDQG
jgi:hypothetical protein